MELISGNKFQQILSDHWEDFYKLNKHRTTRNSIPINVNKIISCGNSLGYNSIFSKHATKLRKFTLAAKADFVLDVARKPLTNGLLRIQKHKRILMF